MVSKSRLATPARALGVAEAELEDDVSRLQFDAEMVVEHEHEIEVEAQATEKPVFGNSDADRRAGQWPLSSLLVNVRATTNGAVVVARASSDDS